MRTVVTSLIVLMYFSLCTADDSAKIAPELFGIEHLSGYLGLKGSDISFRSDYTEPDSFRTKLVADLMREPLNMIDYAGGLENAHVSGQPEILTQFVFQDLIGEYQSNRRGPYRAAVSEITTRYNLYYTQFNTNQLLSRVATYIDLVFPRSVEKMFAGLSKSQRKSLSTGFKELLVMDEDEENYSAEKLDSLEQVEEAYTEEFVSFGGTIDPDPIVSAGIDCLRELLLEANGLRGLMKSGAITAEQVIEGTGYLPSGTDLESYLGLQTGWKIGGPGADYYSGEYQFILDFGGDDIYNLEYDPQNPHGVIIIDFSGDDHYRGMTDFALASGCFSVGLLLDFEGNDRYDCKSFGLGSGYFGLGVLYDAAGDDRYDGDTHVQGAGSFGIGILIDEGGRDIYNSAVFSQGFGFVRGAGIIYEKKGSDTYYAGGKYKDVLRYEDHYLSLSQGFGYGLRPWMSGGIGAIIDIEGNDNFYADIFAQGCSYWWSLGVIYNTRGNDNYQAFQYGQGAAAHMSLGILVDDFGSDVYFGKGLMHGCGHDYSCGLILDRHGDDTYTAYDLSQAAGSANGAGVQIDNEGDDRYFVKRSANTQGYGNPRRDFGSIGLFIDLAGDDQYAGNGRNDHYWRTDSKWGGGMDIELNPVDSLEGRSVGCRM